MLYSRREKIICAQDNLPDNAINTMKKLRTEKIQEGGRLKKKKKRISKKQ